MDVTLLGAGVSLALVGLGTVFAALAGLMGAIWLIGRVAGRLDDDAEGKGSS